MIVPVYSDWTSLSSCIDSLLKYVNDHHQVIFVNDRGPQFAKIHEEIEEKIRQKPNFKLFLNERNVGFVKTANRAVFELDQTDNDILLLNSDTELTENAIEEMLFVLYASERHGVVMPRSNNASIASIPIVPTLKEEEDLFENRHKAYRGYLSIKAALPRYSVVPVTVGFCMLIKRVLIKNFGLFDEIYGKGYNEENDFCMRIGNLGFSSVMSNWSFVFHSGSKSFSKSLKNKLETLNRKTLDQRYPYYGRLISYYLQRDVDPVDYFASLIYNGSPFKILINITNFPPVINATTLIGHNLLKKLKNDKNLEVSILSNRESALFHDLKQYGMPVLFQEDLEGKIFHLGYAPGQFFSYESLFLMNRHCLSIAYGLFDIIALRCQYLIADNKKMEDVFKDSIQYANAINVISEFTKQDVNAFFPDLKEVLESKVTVIHPGFPDKDDLVEKRGASRLSKKYMDDVQARQFEDYVLVYGNLFKHKAIEPLMKFFENGRHNYVVLGSFDLKAKSDNVIVIPSGTLSNPDMKKLIVGAWALLFPSQYEGFGLPILEAAAFGKPLLYCDNRVSKEVVENYVSDELPKLSFTCFEEIPGKLDQLKQMKIKRDSFQTRTLDDYSTDVVKMLIHFLETYRLDPDFLRQRWDHFKKLKGVNTYLSDPKMFPGWFARLKRYISKLGEVFLILRPHLFRIFTKVITDQRSRKFLREFFALCRREGLAPLKEALTLLAKTKTPSAVRRYIEIKFLHTLKHRAHCGVDAPSLLSRIDLAKDSCTICVGLVEHFGDIVACEPVARYLKKKKPNATLSWVVCAPYRSILDQNPFVDEVIVVDCLSDWIKILNQGLHDIYVDLHIDGKECKSSKVSLYKTQGSLEIHGDNYYNHGNLLKAMCIGAGLEPIEDEPAVYIPNEAVSIVDALKLPQRFMVFHCRSNERSRNWNSQKWNELATRIEQQTDLKIVEVGLDPILRPSKNRLNLCGRLSLMETAEVIRRAILFVGIDSGPAHFANALKIPGVILLGKYKNFDKYNPYSGRYGDLSNATLVCNSGQPTSKLPVDLVLKAVLGRCKPDFSVTSGIESKEEGPRRIAFYLSQFYPIPLNDQHWGKGFTEWRNVAKTQPFYQGHYQPRLPGDLGYYDLRLPEIMNQQAELAHEYGISAFCYYLYWFQGKRLLNLPIDYMLRSKKPDFPFCFCWANENWTRRWDGMNREIMIAQEHTPQDDLNFIRHLLPAFEDPRYIRVNGKPLLLIYRTELFPNPLGTTELWREEVRKAGIGDIYLVRCEGFDSFAHPESIGFDASYEAPTFILPEELLFKNLKSLKVNPNFRGKIFDYQKIVDYYSKRPEPLYKRYKNVMLAWDNTARYGENAVIFHGATPELYREWLENSLCHANRQFQGEEQLVFINAWNEWAEGSYLEPDLIFGKSFLEATRSAVHSTLIMH
ncbi:MAG TPA: glycoside hydrolase family 99-like domain-containing protein [Chlamydiales bacterium]|nr:glycoside hydrolase family 99-like domain-containing protein [Chlamydiales bacterium]